MATEGGAMAVGGIVVPLGLDTSSVPADLRRLSGEMEQWKAKQLQQMTALRNLGFVMSATMTLPIEMFVKRSISESIMAEQVSKRLNISLRNMGGSAGITRREIDDLGMSMLRMSNYTDEATRSAAASLLKFKVIRGDVFRDTLKTSADMAAALEGVSLESAAQMLGRALVNPGQGTQMLRRAGIVFTKSEQEKIKSTNEGGDTQGAQRLMLNAINERTGGAAKEMVEPFTQMKNAFGEVMEATGAYVRKQYLMDQGASVLRDTFLSLAKTIETTKNPFVALGANVVAVATKLPPLLAGVSQYAKSANDIKAAIGNFGPLLGLTKGAGVVGGVAAAGGALNNISGSGAAMLAAQQARRTAQSTSALVAREAAEVAAARAAYGTRFKPASFFEKEANIANIAKQAQQQNGAATAAMQAAQRTAARETAAATALASNNTGMFARAAARLGMTLPQVGIVVGAITAGVWAAWQIGKKAAQLLYDKGDDAYVQGEVAKGDRARVQRRMEDSLAQDAAELAITQERERRPLFLQAQDKAKEAEINARRNLMGDTLAGRMDFSRQEGERLAKETKGLSVYGGGLAAITGDFSQEDINRFRNDSINRLGGKDTAAFSARMQKDVTLNQRAKNQWAEQAKGEGFAGGELTQESLNLFKDTGGSASWNKKRLIEEAEIYLAQEKELTKQAQDVAAAQERQLQLETATADAMQANLDERIAQSKELEKLTEYTRTTIGNEIKSMLQAERDAQTSGSSMQTFLQLAQKNSKVGEAPKDALPMALQTMSPEQRKGIFDKISQSKGKMGLNDLTDIGMQIQQSEVQREKAGIAGESKGMSMELGSNFNMEGLQKFMMANMPGAGTSEEDKAKYERITGSAKGLLTKEQGLQDQRLSRITDIDKNSTWEKRNVAGAVEQGSLAGYQASIAKEKEGITAAQIEKNTAAMKDFLKQLVEWMTGKKATNQLTVSVEGAV